MKNKPIGVFDSGVGGLTVFRALARTYPSESIIYFGDTGRYPYGVRSKRVIVEFGCQIASYLQQQGCKFLVVACNSASALALDEIAACVDIEVIGVIEPGARAAARATRTGRIGVIGTEATIQSESYARAIRRVAPDVKITARPCPLFVSLAEEGFAGKAATRLIAEEYLEPLRAARVDTLVLGCTHYPLLMDDIAAVMGPDVQLIDSAGAVAQAVGKRLSARNHHADHDTHVEHCFYVSDTPEKFARVGRRFLEQTVAPVDLVDLEELSEYAGTPRRGDR